jgi:hypothetical protein
MDSDFLSNDLRLVPVNTVEQKNNMNKLNQVNNVNNNLVRNTTSNMMPFTHMSNIATYVKLQST